MSLSTVFVGWQSPRSRTWYTIGKVSFDTVRHEYEFKYTRGVLNCKSEFALFSGMDKVDFVYKSKEPFPFIQNRLLPKKRPEYKDFISWLGINDNINPLEELAYSGGVKGTDSLEFFSYPNETNQDYTFKFFIRGIRHLPSLAIDRIKELNVGDDLYLMRDWNNKSDDFAVAIRSGDPICFIGYCPKYFSKDLCELVDCNAPSDVISASVNRVNHYAPLQYLLSVIVKVKKRTNLEPMSSGEFEEICLKSNISLLD